MTFRPIRAEDEDFLRRVYVSTRVEELAFLSWTEAQKAEFLRQQFKAQHRFYQEQFNDATFDIVLLDDRPIGRLYVDRRENEIRLIDIALLPEVRGRGIGTSLMQELLTEARRREQPLRIHVERNNPALRLYRRLGFESIEDQGVYYLMEWRPDAAS